MTDRGVIIIGLFKLSKAALLLLVAIGAFSLLDYDLRVALTHRIGQLSGDPQYHGIQKIAEFLGASSKRRMELLGAGSFFYAALFGTEGVGLLLQKRWAEYLTVIVTASFLPFDIYEIVRYPGKFRIVLLAINILVVVYLIWRLKSHPKKSRH